MDLGLLDRFPRAGLAQVYAPLERWSRFEQLTGQETWAKRDDIGPLGFGGSKFRKLDLILGQALADGASVVLTTGAIQSNHCRITAAAAAHLGLPAIIFLRGERPVTETGNVLLTRILGAEIIYLGPVSYEEVDRQMEARARALAIEGHSPCIIPLGAATSLGTVAHVEATRELAEQCLAVGLSPAAIVVAVGSGSTFAGVCLGAEFYLPRTRVVGVSVSWSEDKIRSVAGALIREASALLQVRSEQEEADLDVRTDFLGPGYTIATEGALAAIRALACTEGVFLDVTYTGKACHALMDIAARHEFQGPVIFWHTGGGPELFSRAAELLE